MSLKDSLLFATLKATMLKTKIGVVGKIIEKHKRNSLVIIARSTPAYLLKARRILRQSKY